MRRLAVVGAVAIVVTAACGGDSTPLEAKAPTIPSTGVATSTSIPAPVAEPTTTPPPPETRSVPLGQNFLIDMGESVAIAGEGLTVTYVALLEDSRCPIGVQCIWAGNATISVALAQAGSPQGAVQLDTMEGPTSGPFAGYTVTLVQLLRGASPGATLRVN